MNTKLSILTVMIILLMCGMTLATTYYVNDMSGNDVYEGNITHPFKTIQKGADVAIAGDTVIVQNGTYYDSNTYGSINGVITIK